MAALVMPGTDSPAASPSARFELDDEVSVTFSWEIRDGQHVVRLLIREGERGTLMLPSPDLAEGWMAGVLREGGAGDLADALCVAARQARHAAARRTSRQLAQAGAAAARRSRTGRTPATRTRTATTGTALTAGQQQAVESARRLAAAAGQDMRAVAELLGWPDDDTVHLVAFGTAVAALGQLLAAVDHLADGGNGELKEWSTTREVCDWLGITVPQLSSLHYRGKGPRRYKFGKENRYRRAEVEKWAVTRAVD